MGIRLIAIDIDGTLLDSCWRIPEANQRAIGAAVARGIEVALVTGRRFHFALPIAEQVPCELTLILNNGALVRSKSGAVHLRQLLGREIARQALEATREFRRAAAVVFDRPGQNQVMLENLDWNDPARRSYFERNRPFLGEASPLESCLTEDPIQVMFSGPVAQMREATALLRAMSISDQFNVAVTEYEGRNLAIVDVVRQGCSKGSTLAEWTRRRGLQPENVLAIGDNLNDREMLEFAGQAVVMGNSVPELKSLGWPVTLTNDEGGVAAAIETYVFGTIPQ